MQDVYLMSAEAVARSLRVRLDTGVRRRQVKRRREEFGDNTLPEGGGQPLVFVFLERFKDVLVQVLLGAAAVSALLQRWGDTLIIAAAILIDAGLSFIQVWRTEKTLEKLREHVQPEADVIRDGELQKISADELVVGDIIELRAGERVPADARLLSVAGLKVREASLTGESEDVSKQIKALTTRTPVANRRNMVFLGTLIVGGSGKAIVTAVGRKSELGKIAQVLKAEPSPPSPLKIKLQQVGLHIGAAVIGALILLFGIGVWLGQDLLETLFTAITLVVSAIPEDLTMILTIALTVGVARILKKRGVVRGLASGETLGAATVICTDKTGTLTQGIMYAKNFLFFDGKNLSQGVQPDSAYHRLGLIGFALLSDARKERMKGGNVEYVGPDIERAALQFVEETGYSRERVRQEWRERDAISFDSLWKYRAYLADDPTKETRTLFVSGAPEVLLQASANALDADGESRLLTSERRYLLQKQIEELATAGNRLVAIAIKRNLMQTEVTHDDVEGLTLLGLLLIRDPIRSTVGKTVQETLQAGVAIKLVTGDHAGTAKAVARQVGLTALDEAVLTSADMERMNDSELADAISRVTIFARVTPLDKQRIVKALKSQGHVVAMTGDGVNDAVALKSADIGVAMGSGKDIAKEASDLVLLDDSFETIVAAIKEGRVIRDNVRKVMTFLLSTNAAEVAIFFASLALRLPLPLLPAQILWINLVTDGTSDVALSLEPEEKGIMQRPPEDPSALLLGKQMAIHIGVVGTILTVATMGMYWWLARLGHHQDMEYVRTMIFTFLSVTSLLSVWSFRSLWHSILKRGIRGNVWVPVSMAVSASMQVVAVYVPPLQRFFGTVALSPSDWFLILSVGLTTVVIIDARKFVFAKFLQPDVQAAHAGG